MAHVQFAIGIWRSVLQHEGWVRGSFAALPGVEVIGASFEVFGLFGESDASRTEPQTPSNPTYSSAIVA
jgi:hypothetical protein